MVDDLELTNNENVLDQIVVRVWRLSKLWLLIFFLPVISFLPFAERYPIIPVSLIILSLWYSTYFIRERWRLTLTNKQIVARQLFPRPFTVLSPIHYFPLNKIEGLTVGPRAFRSILLLGVFISTNLGVTLLKSGLSTRSQFGYELPDTMEAILLIMEGITFIPFLGRWARDIEEIAGSILESRSDALIVMGMVFIILGLITVILTIPRRYHLQIRMRHSKDFQLSAGIPKSFWRQCYQQLYDEEIVEAPSDYSRWKFPWLKGEQMQTSADLEEIIYLNRFIGLFAIYIGSLRIWDRASAGKLGEDILLWLIVAVTDIFIAGLAVFFSKKRNEMVVTNRRIIFAQEMKDISGAFGRRLFLMSDISRDDVAGFNILRLKGLSYGYMALTIIMSAVTIVFWDDLPHDSTGVFVKIVFILIILLFATFINQTYVEFNLKTKGNEIWHLRHQLSNPLTRMRQLIGNDENILLTTIMSNRLEEKEIVDTTQIIRTEDIELPAKLFNDSKFYGESDKVNSQGSREIMIDDLLLEGEKISYEANVSRGVPHRVLNLTIGSFLMIGMGSIFIIPFLLTYPSTLQSFLMSWSGTLIAIPFVMIAIMIIALWILYYSLFKARIVITDRRVFFLDNKHPPLLLYLLGVTSVSQIDETLQDQIHSTYTSRQWSQQQYWKDLIRHSLGLFVSVTVLGITIALLISITEGTIDIEGISQVLPILLVIFFLSLTKSIWHVGNGYIAFIRSIPRRVIHTKGVGSHFIVPFASKEKADSISETVWNGVITE